MGKKAGDRVGKAERQWKQRTTEGIETKKNGQKRETRS